MAVTTIRDLMSHEEPSLYGGADMLHIDSYNVFQIAQRIMSHLCLHNGVYRIPCVFLRRGDLAGLISQCWKGWCIGPIELTVCEILKENLHDAASHWHLTSCHFAPSWLPTYFSASALAVEVPPLACSKKRVKFEIRAESSESFARVLHSLW